MPKQKRRGTDNQSQRFVAGSGFRLLIGWLNAKGDDLPRQRVRKLLRNIRVLTSNWDLVDDGEGGALVYRGSQDAVRDALREVVGLLRRYKFFPLILPFGDRTFRQWTPVSGPDGKFKRGWPPTYGEYDDVQAVYELATPSPDEHAERILECACERWFYQRFSHQKFCSAKCRDKANKATPQSKEYRRRKAREYYWLHKHKNVR